MPKISDKSALDPQSFLDFKLKKVEPYNYNTARCVLLPSLFTLSPIPATRRSTCPAQVHF